MRSTIGRGRGNGDRVDLGWWGRPRGILLCTVAVAAAACSRGSGRRRRFFGRRRCWGEGAAGGRRGHQRKRGGATFEDKLGAGSGGQWAHQRRGQCLEEVEVGRGWGDGRLQRVFPFDEGGCHCRMDHGRTELRGVGGRQRRLEGRQRGLAISGGHGVEEVPQGVDEGDGWVRWQLPQGGGGGKGGGEGEERYLRRAGRCLLRSGAWLGCG